MGRGHLVVFVKAPRLGAVKTRLGRQIGHLAAWRFHRRMLRELSRRLARDRRWRCVLVVTPDDGAIAEWPRDIPRIGQGRGDLGQRMARAMAAVPAGPVVLVGGDIPGLGPEHVDRAFAALRRAEVVFGPAADGGFWLVGLRRGRRARQLFRDVRWSSPQALTDTLANLPAAARVALVDELADVDTAEDYRRFLDRGT